MTPPVAVMICFACFTSKIAAQKPFFSSVSKRSRNGNEDKKVEELELDQKEKQDEKEVEKEKQVTTSRTLRKFRVERKPEYSWLDYKDGKMFYLWCCEYSNLSNASSPFVTRGCTLRSPDISTSLDNVVKVPRARKNPAAAPSARAVRILPEEDQNKLKKLFEVALWLN